MAKGKKTEIKHRQVAIGDMRHLVELLWMDLTAPRMQGDYDASLNKTTVKRVWAAFETLAEVEFFNQANIEKSITDYIYIRWFPSFQYNSTQYYIRRRRVSTTDQPEYEYFDVISSDDLDKRREFIVLKCAIRAQEIDVPEPLPVLELKEDITSIMGGDFNV